MLNAFGAFGKIRHSMPDYAVQEKTEQCERSCWDMMFRPTERIYMKILFNHTHVHIGGAESILRILADYLANRGHSVTVAAIPEKASDFDGAYDPKVKCIRARLNKKRDSGKFEKIFGGIIRKIYRLMVLAYMNRQHYDVSIAFIEGLPATDALQIKAKKRFAWIHCDLRYFNEKAWHSSISEEHRVYEKYDNVVCVSGVAKTGYIETLGDTGNLIVRYNPVNWHDIREKANDRCPVVKDPSKPLIVTVGTLGKIKNYGILLEAVKQLKNIIPFDVWMIGKGGSEEEKRLKEYTKENDLDNVRFLGYQKNPYCYLKQADLFVSTSISESYGLAVQEALVLGKPVIAVRCPGIEEAFDERFGRIIDNSARELADNIRDLFGEPSKLRDYSRSIAEDYQVESLYEERIDAICRLIEEI